MPESTTSAAPRNTEEQLVGDPFDYPDHDDDDGERDEVCGECGSHLDPNGFGEPGCPDCLPCGGCYAPGSEECDFCHMSDDCAKWAAEL